jgi:hypothetical protein
VRSHEGQGGASPEFVSRHLYNQDRSTPMLDAVMLAIGFVFFALSIAYVYACDLL